MDFIFILGLGLEFRLWCYCRWTINWRLLPDRRQVQEPGTLLGSGVRQLGDRRPG